VIGGFEVLAQLKADPTTSTIPVIIVTSKVLTTEEQQYLETETQAVLAKETLSSEIVLETLQKIIDLKTAHLSLPYPA
jgi:CheY-like chemotaxis protein